MVRVDEDKRFSHALTSFLEQECVRGVEYSIADARLFPRFRAFWMQTPERFDHPSLLGQFRVELAQRGFLATASGKHPRWVGLTLRRQDRQIRAARQR